MELVERDEILAELRSEASAARRRGRFVLITGTAGVGKTSVARALAENPGASQRVLWGTCDALATPRPLGPLYDMAHLSSALADLLATSSNRHALFSGLVAELETHPSVVVLEDIHWADEATLDLILFLGRRAERTRSLIVTTYRHDEVDMVHPLRRVLGDLATAPGQRRVRVEPLSLSGVRTIASHHPVDADHLYRITNGNPFYVTEVLAAPGWTVPPTVADAVAARAARLSSPARGVLETVSVEPARVERRLLGLLGHDSGSIDEALASGMLVPANGTVGFRHELARLSMYEFLDFGRRRELHRSYLEFLENEDADPARLSHHAKGGEEHAALLRWATAAARDATRTGAHREAASHYEDAIAAASRVRADDSAMAGILEGYAAELSILDRRTEALSVRQQIVELRSRTDDAEAHLASRADLAHALWAVGEGDAGHQLMEEVVAQAAAMEGTRAAAHAYAMAGYLAMLAREGQPALHWCRRAIALSEEGGFDDLLIRALNALGSARICSFVDEGGIADLEQSAAIADAHGWDAGYADALENLGSALGEIRRYEQGVAYLNRSIAYAEERDMDGQRHYSVAWLARILFDQGRWREASEMASSVPADAAAISPISPIVALTVLGRVRARRGEGGAADLLDEAWVLARRTNDLQRLWPVMAGRAEAAWLSGAEIETATGEVAEVLAIAETLELSWAVGELSFWAWKLRLSDGPAPEGAAAPYQLHIDGHHQAASQAWAEIGCPYEQAWALADAGDETSLRSALDILNQLGAGPLADRVRQSLRQLDATGIPSGPRPATARHPGGLTPRQGEVLELICRGLSDRQIGELLFISPRTAGHHVAAILRKLEVSSRAEAAARAFREGWVSTES